MRCVELLHHHAHHDDDQDSAVVRVVATDADRNRTISYRLALNCEGNDDINFIQTISYSIEGLRNITKLVGIDKSRYLAI